MKTYREMMNEIEVKSYKDCAWYLDKDKCKLPGPYNEKYSKCFCKDKDKMEDVCVWITKFLKSTPLEQKEQKEDEIIEEQWKEYNELIFDEENNDVIKIESPLFRKLNKFLKKFHFIS